MHVLMFVFIHIFCPFLVELKITSFMSMHIVQQMCAAFYISRHIWWLYKASYGHLIPQVFLRSILEASTVITNSGRFNVTQKKMLIFFCRKTGCLFRDESGQVKTIPVNGAFLEMFPTDQIVTIMGDMMLFVVLWTYNACFSSG